MTPRQKNLETIRAAAIKANPEIVELKFGCQVQRYEGDEIDTLCSITSPGLRGRHAVRFIRFPSVVHYDFVCATGEVESWKIIGRPIRLADVLLALKEQRGYLGVTILEKEHWNLRADSLEEQSDECIAFLADLLRVQIVND